MNPVRVGVVGVGRLGREHARILAESDECRLAGVHDRALDRGERVARDLGTRHHRDLQGLLSSTDAVVVAVPTAAHHAVALAALEAGCHVLVEKPLTATLEEAEDLVRSAARRGLRLYGGHVERFNPAVREAWPHLADPRFVESVRIAPFRERGTDVPVVLDLMIHDIDLVLGMVDAGVREVRAVGVSVLSDSLDVANARLVFDDGAVADLTASRVSPARVRELRCFQRTGLISLDLARGRGEFIRRGDNGSGTEGLRVREGPDGVDRVSLGGDGPEPLRLELEEFLAGLRGREAGIATGEESRAALEVALEITRQIEHDAHVPA